MSRQYIWINHSRLDVSNLPYRNAYGQVANIHEFPVDRFNVTDGLLELPTANIVNKPVYDLFSKTTNWRSRYFDTIDIVADNVYNTAGDTKVIHVLYSGGIDSMCVLIALQRSKHYKDFLNQGRFKLSMTSTSIDENKEFFFKQILPNIPICPLNFSTLMNDSNTLLVTGDMGDYVIGSSDVLYHNNIDLMSSYHILLDRAISDEYRTILNCAKQHQPFELESVNQMMWWVSQCFCYQDELVRPFKWSTTKDLSSMGTNDKVFRFFYDAMLLTFSYEYMSTNPVMNSFEDARQFPKEYIANHTGDNSVYNKQKVYSQRLTLRTVNKTSMFVDNGVLGYDMSAELINGC